MYTIIFMSSRGNSVRQYAISPGHVLLFWIAISAVFLGALGGLVYGFYLKQQEAVSKKNLQTSIAEIEELARAKHQVESQLAAINEEMKDIRDMANQIQQTLEIFGQGGGSNNITSGPEEAEGGDDIQQENADAALDIVIDTPERQEPLTPTSLKQEIQPLHNYVKAYQQGLDGYPSILPVKLQKANGEKYKFWYSSGFGWRVHPLTKRREFHRGLDIKTRSGVPVIAAADGVVVKIGRNGFFGNTIEIKHERSQFKTLYAHLKSYARGLKVGQQVARGQTIGYVGNTGRSTGAHLHYGVYDIRNKKWVNPMPYIFDQQPIFSQ